jgi:hypothetical protein
MVCQCLVHIQGGQIYAAWNGVATLIFWQQTCIYRIKLPVMLNYSVSYKDFKTKMGDSGKITWEERRKLLIENLCNFFSDIELKEVERSNKYILIDDSGNEVVYLLVPAS